MKNLKFNLCQKKYKTDRELYDKVKKVIKFDLNRNQKIKWNFHKNHLINWELIMQNIITKFMFL